MAKYILVYSIDDYPDNGGGTFIEYPKDESDLIERVNLLNTKYQEIFKVECAGFLSSEITFKAVKYATKLEPE
jgi:hypothetical protein